MDLFNNQWFIGIGTSIISGLLVFFFTKRFFSTKENKEYDQKVKTANNDILYSLRPLIVQKKLPSKDIIESLLSATSEKYNVNVKDLYNLKSLSDILVNEILSNPFLSSDQKLELCEIISEMKKEDKVLKKESPKVYSIERRPLSINYLSMLMAMMTGMIGIVLTFYMYYKGDSNLFEQKLNEPVLLIIITLLIPTIALASTSLFRSIRRNEYLKHITTETKSKEETKEKTIKDNISV